MTLEFLNGDLVRRLSDDVRGQVHHAMQFTGEPWKYVVDFPGGDRQTLLGSELVKDEDA